jgi:hypothetical protein
MIDFGFDIETIPDQRPGAYEEILANIKPPANYKKQETIDKWLAEQGVAAAMDQYHRTGLHGISGEICSIAWALGSGEPKSLIRRSSEPEALLLQTFFQSVFAEAEKMSDGWPRFQWIGHNLLGFDLRFLQQRCWINNVEPAFPIPVDARHGKGTVFDTMVAWCGQYGTDRYVSQDALAQALGMAGKEGIDGSMVWDLYQMQEYQQIQDYNEDDIRTVMGMYRRLTWAS